MILKGTQEDHAWVAQKAINSDKYIFLYQKSCVLKGHFPWSYIDFFNIGSNSFCKDFLKVLGLIYFYILIILKPLIINKIGIFPKCVNIS